MTADDVVHAIYYTQAIPLDAVDPDELRLQRPAAALMATLNDAGTIEAFADWFQLEHPAADRFDARDLRRYWHDFGLHRIRERWRTGRAA